MEPSTELKDVVLRFYDAVARGDAAFIEQMTSRNDGLLCVGTDPSEWWTGYATVIQMYRAQMQEMGGGFPIVPGDPQAFSEGTVGWVGDRAKFKFPDGTEIPFRFTAVFHREDSEWKIVQQHISIGVRNEEAIGKELTV